VQSIYWFCFVLGGAFVALSMFSGDAFGDADADFDADLDADADFDGDLDGDVGGDLDGDVSGDIQVDTDVELLRPNRRRKGLPALLSILTSFKFWTFGGCFFGLAGLLIGAVEPGLAPAMVLAIALTIGLLCGGTLVTTLRNLKHRQVNSLVRNEDFAGLPGIVELPFDAKSKGKVRLEVGGSTLHLVAQTDEQRDFQPGDAVLVVGRSNNRLWVVSADHSVTAGEIEDF
jgi:membrane protein implicated in regulation of membrane protease activity